MILKRIFIFLTLIISLSCEEDLSLEVDSNIDESTYSWDKPATGKGGWKHSKLRKKTNEGYIEALSENDKYSSSFKGILSNKLFGHNVKVTLEGEYKILAGNKAVAIISTSDGGNDGIWLGNDLKWKEGQDWIPFQKSVVIPVLRDSNYTIKAFVKNKHEASIELKNLNISFKKHYFKSYTQDVPAISQTEKWDELEFLKQPLIILNSEKGNVKIIPLKLEELKKTIEVDQLSLSIYKTSQNYNVAAEFKDDITIKRLALVGRYSDEIIRITDYAGRSTSIIPKHEFWLGAGSITLELENGRKKKLNVNEGSSIQVRPSDSLIIINWDYEKDHPLIYYPELDSSRNKFDDISANKYHKKEKLQSSFNIEDVQNRVSPTILPTKNGFQSTIIWTEHADYADIKLHKATYYGSEHVAGPSNAVGGFCKYKIPVTKSIFFNSDDTIRNSDYRVKTEFNSLIASVQSTPGYISFLDSIYEDGHEICLHSPDFYTTTEAVMDSALSWITKRYGSKSWIDHGYDNGPLDNRENFMCEGIKSFSKKLWDKYDIQYMWNGYYEEVFPHNGFKFAKSNMSPYPQYMSSLPNNYFWRNKLAGDKRVSWRTNSAFYPKDWAWSYYYNENRLKKFTDDFGLEILHCYPAHVAQREFWTYDEDSNLIARPQFNKALSVMAAFRDKGLLWLPTIGDFLDHQNDLKGVKIVCENGQVYVLNENQKSVKGVTLLIEENMENFKIPQSVNYRNEGNKLFIWFDLKPKEKKSI